MAEETKLKFQVSLFGNFSQYGVTEENLRKCFENFFKFQVLPSQVQEVNPATGKSDTRISLQSINKGFMINLMSDRMDILAMPMPGTPASQLTEEGFVESGLPVAKELLEMFPAPVSRVGFVVESFMAPLPEDQLDAVRSKFLGPKLTFTQPLPTNEWNIRDVVIGELVGIPSNFIFAIARVKAQMADARGFREQQTHHLMIDVNSVPNEGAEFKNFAIIESYVAKAVDTFKTMKAEIEGRVYG